MVPLAATPEFQAVFTADLDTLRLRADAALETLRTAPADPEAQGSFGTALHGLKGLAGIAGARPLGRVVSLLERLSETAMRLARQGDAAEARDAFIACRGPAGELNALLDATAAGRGKTPEAELFVDRLSAAAISRWPEVRAPEDFPQTVSIAPPPDAIIPPASAAQEEDVLAFLQELGVESPAPAPAWEPAATPPETLVPGEDAVDAEMLQYFVPETGEYCEGIEKALADLENCSAEGSLAPRRELMRLWHTIKGAANSIGLNTLGRLAHAIEEAFEEESPLPVVEQAEVGGAALGILQKFLREYAAAPAGQTPRTPPEPVDALVARVEQRCREAAARLAMPPAEVSEPLPLPAAREPAPVLATADAAEPAFEAPGARVDPGTLDQLMDLVGELSISRNRLLAKVQTFTQIQSELESCKNRLLRVVGNFQERHEYSAGANGPGGGSRAHRPAGFGELEFDQYDEINLLSRALVEIGADTGELIEQSRRFFGAFEDDSDGFRKTSVQLQEAITQVRMVPMASLFRRLRRVAAEAAGKEGKEIEWETEGGETRLDKVIVESIFGPLLHLVRNAVGHGVESPEQRQAAGKPRAGKVRLRGSQKSNQALIILEDDGGGLDFDAIRARGISTGLLTPEEAAGWNESQLVGLIFKSGFSTRTAEQVNDVGGRGVGLDVVLQQITRLNGSVEIESRAGQGCTLTLTLPMTLAIGQAMFVRVGGQTFALPLAFVDRLAPCPPEAVEDDPDLAGEERLRVESVEGGPVPLLRLEELFGLPAPATPIVRPMAVIARLADQRVAFPIEALLRRADIVTKPLGPLLADHPLFSGATVDTDGRVVLILDVPRLAQDFFARRGLFAGARTRVTPMPRPVVEREPERVREAVLIVDDSLSVRKVAEKYAIELGYDVETANDGVAALEKLERRRFACVLTDLEMPRLDGFGLLTELREREATRELPVIVVTSRQAEKHRQRATALGATDYLVKPFSKEQLGEKLASCRAAPVLVAAA